MALDPPSAASVARALAEFPELRRPGVAPLSGGLINQSFAVTELCPGSPATILSTKGERAW